MRKPPPWKKLCSRSKKLPHKPTSISTPAHKMQQLRIAVIPCEWESVLETCPWLVATQYSGSGSTPSNCTNVCPKVRMDEEPPSVKWPVQFERSDFCRVMDLCISLNCELLTVSVCVPTNNRRPSETNGRTSEQNKVKE